MAAHESVGIGFQSVGATEEEKKMATAVDPICKMDVDTDNPPGGHSEHEGTTYYFCAPGCKVAFEKEPEKYLADDWGGLPMESPHMETQPKKGSFLSRLFGRGS